MGFEVLYVQGTKRSKITFQVQILRKCYPIGNKNTYQEYDRLAGHRHAFNDAIDGDFWMFLNVLEGIPAKTCVDDNQSETEVPIIQS